MILVLEMIVHQNMFRRFDVVASVYQQMSRDTFPVQTNSTCIDAKSGGTEGLSKEMLIPYCRRVWTKVFLKLMIYYVVIPVPAQS